LREIKHVNFGRSLNTLYAEFKDAYACGRAGEWFVELYR
jgi:hypothetical protein